jgi:hypothetical protein
MISSKIIVDEIKGPRLLCKCKEVRTNLGVA